MGGVTILLNDDRIFVLHFNCSSVLSCYKRFIKFGNGFFYHKWKPDNEPGSLSGFSVDEDRPFVVFYYHFGYRKPQPYPFCFGAEKRKEYLGKVLWLNAGTGILK